jgi:hypothetical protein
MEKHLTAIAEYIVAVKSIQPDDAREHTYRTPLENLLNTIQFPTKKITPIHEGKSDKLDVDGTPDFFIYQDYESLFKTLVGFIECKKIFFDLDTLIKSKQVEKYSRTSENIIITNYRDFILLQKGKIEARVSLIDERLVETTDKNLYQDFLNLLMQFYNYEYQYIKTKKSLTLALARQSFYYSVALREYIEDKSNEGENFHFKFKGLFDDFQKSIQYSYDLTDFCDIYAQSLVYGLMLARLEDAELRFDEGSIDYLRQIPRAYRLLKEFLKNGYEEDYAPIFVKKALISIGKNINLINIESIQKEFNKENNGKSNIAVYLYEEFLKSYDELRKTEKRKEGGVYYTPKAATSFIVRGVNHILKEHFGLTDGYMDKTVKVLDFACGTGTFIDSIFDIIIHDDMDELEKRKVKEKIKNDYYGFEILFTPYIVAHTILTKHLRDKGITILDNERLGIYLTNTLDISQHSISGLLPNLKNEHEKAARIKNDESILAVVGNPPYNVNSKDKNAKILEMIQDYKPENEANVKPLNNDYVKFIRFAQFKIEKNQSGVVGVITDNSFLENITFYKMREELLKSFDCIYILNLHGENRKNKTIKDTNIFDIQQGVCISFFIKNENVKDKGIYYYSTKDNDIFTRAGKLELLAAKDLENLGWKKLNPLETKDVSFVSRNLAYLDEYSEFMPINCIFNTPSLPIMSKKDYANKERKQWIAYQYTEGALDALRDSFLNNTPAEIKSIYNISEESDWFIVNAKEDLTSCYNPQKIQYRAYDYRYTSLSHSKGFLARPSYNKVGSHFSKNNLGLIFERGCNSSFNHAFITEIYTDFHCIGGGSYLAPLYLYKEEDGLFGAEKTTNFTPDFLNNYINQLEFDVTPEEVMAYIYAVLHSPVYREKYLEFLKTDFPAIPMTKDKETFYKYALLGKKLIDLHLLQNMPSGAGIKVSFTGDVGNNFVIKKITPPTPTEDKLMLTTARNNVITFTGVSKEVYDFEIGSYKPIDKWLKYRIKDEVILGIEDLDHIKNMITAIKNTISVMGEIEWLGEDYLK